MPLSIREGRLAMELNSMAELEQWLVSDSDRAKLQEHLRSRTRHTSYKHYARQGRIAGILETGFLYLSDGSTWNDRIDGRSFNSERAPEKNFGCCFSWSSSESIAMWMLYGGRGKDGAMIDFPRRAFPPDGADVGMVRLGRFGENGFEALCTVHGANVHIGFADVLYVDDVNEEKGSTLRLTFSGGRTSFHIRSSALELLPRTVIKARAWEYEQETRLIASVPKDLLEGREERITTLQLPISVADVLSANRIYRSPLCDAPESYRPSALTNCVDWDLCDHCEYLEQASE